MEDKKQTELVPAIPNKNEEEKTSGEINLQEKLIKALTLYANGFNKFGADIEPTLRALQRVAANFSLNLQQTGKFLEKIGSIQKDFFGDLQLRIFENMAKTLEEKSKEEIEVLINEVEEKKSPKKTSGIKKLYQEANQKALLDLQKDFIPMLNGIATNQLTHINTVVNPPCIDKRTGNATIHGDSFKVFINKYSELKLKGVRTSTLKLLDICTLYLTKQNTYKCHEDKIISMVEIPIEDYMRLCAIPITKSSKDKTRKRLKEDLDTLFHIHLDWKEFFRGKTKDYKKIRICDEVGIVRGKIKFNFAKKMSIYLTSSFITKYSLDLLKTDERNSNAYPLGRKLSLHYGISNNRKKGTYNLIKVNSLLKVCPDIPTYETVMKDSRHIDKRIKIPFEKALDALNFICWEYSNSKGKALTQEQLEATDYKTFENLYIKFNILDFPEETEDKKTKKAYLPIRKSIPSDSQKHTL